jgi:hypothetical protein
LVPARRNFSLQKSSFRVSIGIRMAGSIKKQVEIQIQRSYPLNSSISAQSTVRFGSIFVNARSSGEKLTIFVNLYTNTDSESVSLPGGRPINPSPILKFPLTTTRVRHTDLKPLGEGDNMIDDYFFIISSFTLINTLPRFRA